MDMTCTCGRAKKGKYSADQCYPCWVRMNIKNPLPPQTLNKASEAVTSPPQQALAPPSVPTEALALVRAQKRMAKTTSKGCSKCGKKKTN